MGRPTTDLPNSTEFECSEENESCSGGYPKFIYSVVGVKIDSGVPQWSAFGPPLIFSTVHNLCVVKTMKVAQEGIMILFIVLGG